MKQGSEGEYGQRTGWEKDHSGRALVNESEPEITLKNCCRRNHCCGLQGHLVSGSRWVESGVVVGIQKALTMLPSKLSTLVRPRKRSQLVIISSQGFVRTQ